MITVAAFLVAAAAGAVARAEAERRWRRAGTLAVNVAGSFLLGLLADVGPPALTVLGVGGLGAFTTFSGFARDSMALVDEGRSALAVAYVGASVVAGVAGAALGMGLA